MIEAEKLKYLKPDNEVLEAFFKLININLCGKSYREILSLYFDHLPLFPNIAIPNYSKSPETFFRAMRCDDEPKEIKRLSYPPPEIARLGRLNIDGYPVLYTSDKPLISIWEINAQPNELIYVGIWRASDVGCQ